MAENSDGVGRFMAYRAASQRIGDRHAGERNVAIGAGLIVILAVWLGIVGLLALATTPAAWLLIAAAVFHAGCGVALGYYRNTILSLIYVAISILAAIAGAGSPLGVLAAIWVIRGTLQLDKIRNAEAAVKT